MPQVITATAHIDAGQSLSDTVDCGDNYVVGMIMPPNWTTAHVSVLLSTDNINFSDLFTFDADSTSATEYIFNVAPAVMIAINPTTMLPARYLKLRSGKRSHPVPQTAARDFTVMMVNQI
jgi:hypothetical protein